MKPNTKENPVKAVISYVTSKASNFSNAFSSSNLMLFVILVIAFVQGVITLADLSVQYLYKDDYHLTPAQVSIATGITGIPWIIKPVWGIISDNIPLFGYRRKTYLMICGLLAGLCWFALSTFNMSVEFGISILLISSMCLAFNSVIGEALIVEAAQCNNNRNEITEEQRQNEASNNVSFFFGVKSIGVLITSYAGGWLLQYTSKYTVFYITMIFPLVAGLSSWLLPEKRIIKKEFNDDDEVAVDATGNIEIVSRAGEVIDIKQNNDNLNDLSTPTDQQRLIDREQYSPNSLFEREDQVNAGGNWTKMTTFIKNPSIYKPIIFIFLFSSTPSTGSAMFFFYTNRLGFTTEFMGEIQLASAIASILGIWIFNRWFRNTSFVKIFILSAIICTLANLTQVCLVLEWNKYLGINDKLFCLTGNLLIQVFAELNIIPILVLACRICPKNVEGTMYAFLMSILNFGSMVSNEWGALNTYLLGITDTNFDNLWLLVLISSLTTVAPLPFINYIDFEKALKLNEDDSKTNLEDCKIEETIREKNEDMLQYSSGKKNDYQRI